jgi:hypothetical protein
VGSGSGRTTAVPATTGTLAAVSFSSVASNSPLGLSPLVYDLGFLPFVPPSPPSTLKLRRTDATARQAFPSTIPRSLMDAG